MLPVRLGTLIMLLVALLFGSLAVFLAKTWLANQQTPVVQVAPPPEKVQTETIVIAKKDLNFGEPLTPDVLSEIDWPKGSRPDGSFSTIADINKDGARVVLTPISPNEPVLTWKISGPGARASLSALVAKGQRAVTIRINDTSGIGGFVLPGDRVDVLYARKGETASIDVLLQNVRVLAINQNNDQKGSNPIDGRTATLELSPVDAEKLALAQATGDLSFTLRAAGSLDPAPARRILESELTSDANVYQPADPTAVAAQAALAQRIADLEAKLKQDEANRAQQIVVEAKTAPAPAPAAAEQAMPTTAQVTIYRGLQGSDYTVPLDANK